MSDKIKKFCPEIAAMILWFAAAITVAVFHEPWFDEIQAWQIARTATWHDLFFEVPHSECHPILWHLILRPFALADLPFEPSIKAVNLVITGAGCALLLFKSELPRIPKLILPFTFMIFYQTAIINRCYCLLFLFFVILGITRRNRDEHPVPYVTAIAFLCMTHVLGMMIGGLICLVWVIQIIKEYAKNKNKGSIFKDKRVLPLALLFLFAVLIMLMIAPSTKNSNFGQIGDEIKFGAIFDRFTSFFKLPYDTTFSLTLNTDPMYIYLLFFVLINGFMLYFCRKKKCIAEFFLPYITFSLFYSIIWFSEHLMVVYYYLFIYIFTAFSDKEMSTAKELLEKIKNPLLKKASAFIASILFVLMTASAAASSYKDIKFNYFDARAISNFINDNGLEDLRIYSSWVIQRIVDVDEENEAEKDNTVGIGFEVSEKKIDPYTEVDVRLNPYAISLAPYFDHIVVANYYDPERNRGYSTFAKSTKQDRIDCYEKLSKEPYPEILIGDIAVLDTIFGEDEVAKHHFKPVYRTFSYFAWKFNSVQYGYEVVWMRTDAMEKYGIKEVPADYNTVI